ncbi:MAG: ABC transporter permease, partial [Planctomycetota bacterium]
MQPGIVSGVPLKYSFRNLLRRPVRTGLTVAGISLLVGLIVFLSAFGRSVAGAVRIPGDPQNLIVLSKKAQSFEFSSIPASELDVMAVDIDEELEAGPDGGALLSSEVYHFLNATLAGDPAGEPRRAILHGIDPDYAPVMLSGFRLTAGTMPEEGEFQLLVGRAVPQKLRAKPEWLGIGTKITIRDQEYTVSGTFETPGVLYENWLICHPEDLRTTLSRQDYSFGRMRVAKGVDMDALASRLNLDERYGVRVLRETEYFADFNEGFDQFQNFAVLLAVFLGFAGVLSGMNTMHNAVVGRIREIGVLRVLGFGKTKVFVAFLIESLALTGAAGVLGMLIGLAADGVPVRVPIAAAFKVEVDPVSLAIGFGAAL